jgi:hypothetical protein
MNGATTGTKYADFDDSYDAINGLTYEEGPSSYTVQGGDTLESIAQQIWGDSNFWYLLADANGLDESSTLVAGQSLIVPDKVTDNQNNNSTYKVYNPNDAMGDLSPTTPPKPQPNHSNCGVFGTILMAIVAVVVSYFVPGVGTYVSGLLESSLGATAAGAVGLAATAAVGDVAGQVFGLATGIEKSFNWKELGITAITAGIGFGVGKLGMFEGLSDEIGQIGVQALQGATANAITQGIGVATGLQKSFNWAGVAAAGASAGAMEGVGEWAEGTSLSSGAANALQGAAGMIAGAASRSLITGTDFGDNILKGLPDTISQTVGADYADEVKNDAIEPVTITPEVQLGTPQSAGSLADDTLAYINSPIAAAAPFSQQDISSSLSPLPDLSYSGAPPNYEGSGSPPGGLHWDTQQNGWVGSDGQVYNWSDANGWTNRNTSMETVIVTPNGTVIDPDGTLAVIPGPYDALPMKKYMKTDSSLETNPNPPDTRLTVPGIVGKGIFQKVIGGPAPRMTDDALHDIDMYEALIRRFGGGDQQIEDMRKDAFWETGTVMGLKFVGGVTFGLATDGVAEWAAVSYEAADKVDTAVDLLDFTDNFYEVYREDLYSEVDALVNQKFSIDQNPTTLRGTEDPMGLRGTIDH